MMDFVFDPELWKKTLLTPEANAATDVLTGQKSVDQAVTDYGTSYITGNVLDSGADALGNTTTDQLYNDAINIPTKQAYPPSLESSGLQDSGIGGQANIKLDNNALNPTIPQQGIDITNSQPTGVQLNDNAYQSINTPSGATNPLPDVRFEGYDGDVTSPANKTVEEPGTFLGLEGKDYAKMGVGAGLNAAVGMAMQPPTPQKPTPPPTPNRPGAYQAPQQSQGMAQTLAVNSNQNPNGFQPMTQAQGLLNPFQADMYRRRGY